MRVYENGVYRDMTESEINALKAFNQRELLENASAYHLTADDILMILAQQILITLPTGETETADKLIDASIELPMKLGYKWELQGTAFVSVPDPDAIGTADNPIIWYDGCPLIDNAFYKRDSKTLVYMAGQFVEW